MRGLTSLEKCCLKMEESERASSDEEEEGLPASDGARPRWYLEKSNYELWALNWARNWATFWARFSTRALQVKICLSQNSKNDLGKVLGLILGREKCQLNCTHLDS